jgi:hypothetical protein
VESCMIEGVEENDEWCSPTCPPIFLL